MASRGEVVWAPDPFKSGDGNPRPWLVVSAERLPYRNEESIAVAFTTQSHHSDSLVVPSEAWVRGEPDTQSHVLPWSVATLKDEIHVVGVQGTVTAEFTKRVANVLIAYLDPSAEDGN
jgi:mRNA-degrading endonuclease toxin of MazEF toxin-antitoxin module